MCLLWVSVQRTPALWAGPRPLPWLVYPKDTAFRRAHAFASHAGNRAEYTSGVVNPKPGPLGRDSLLRWMPYGRRHEPHLAKSPGTGGTLNRTDLGPIIDCDEHT